MNCVRPYFSAFAVIAECAIATFAYDQCNNSPTVWISMRQAQRKSKGSPAFGRSLLTAGLGVVFMINKFLYAIKKNLNGTLDLTVFEDGNSCTVTLNKEMTMQLIKLLSHQNQWKK